MNTIMVVEDVAIFREPLAASLQQAGYRAICAGDGLAALKLLKLEHPDLVLLDISLPTMDGLTFLKYFRSISEYVNTPVIVLSGASGNQQVMQAAALGVRDYMLKSRLKLSDLLARVEAKLKDVVGVVPQVSEAAPAVASVAPVAAVAAPAVVTPAPAVAAPTVATEEGIPQLMTREQCIERAQQAMDSKTLPGAVAQVIALATSPQGNLPQLAGLISHDPMLSARVLQLANRVTYASKLGTVTSITDAVRHIGFSAVRNIASTIGIFDTMPGAKSDGFSPVRCWQHSLAVARLCEHLSAGIKDTAGSAYLTGLCHDLGEIIFKTHFAAEYRQVLETQRKTGERLDVLERQMLGMTHHDLVVAILGLMGLPDAVRRPIEVMYSENEGETAHGVRAAAATLRIANSYANGLLLSSSEKSRVAPVTRAACKMATGQGDPTLPGGAEFRNEIVGMTLVLARMSPAEERELITPLFPRKKTKVWLARDAVYSTFCPVAAALESMAEVVIHDRLPNEAEMRGFQGLVILAPGSAAVHFGREQIEQVGSGLGSRLLWLTGRVTEADTKSELHPTTWPISLESLAAYVAGLSAGGVVKKVAAA